MWEAIAALLAVIVAALRFYLDERKKRGTYEGDVAEMGKAIAGRDTDSMSRLFDELRRPGGEGNPGGPDDKGATERKL